MAIDISKSDLIEFQRMTGVDVVGILTQCADFFTSSYSRIVSYYSGTASGVNKGDFIKFDSLVRQLETIFVAFSNHATRLNNLRWWLLLEKIEDVDSRFKSLAKINKWSKSSLSFFGYDPAMQAHYTIKSKQTLERVSQDVLKNDNPTDDWVGIALSNQLAEEDYTPAGGVDLLLSFPRINSGININSVVDVMVDKNIYGKDFDKKLHFINDDLAILSPDDTVTQSVLILANLRKNDNPDFPEQGLQSNVVVGGSRAALNFPVITRQLTETFASDDSLKNFQLANIAVDQDNLNIDIQVETRLNEVITQQVIV